MSAMKTTSLAAALLLLATASAVAGLPIVPSGAVCGVGVGQCAPKLCCSSIGICSAAADACGVACQPAFSGIGSACTNSSSGAGLTGLPTMTATLVITRGTANLDGSSRDVILINGATPGPTLTAYTGQWIEITVDNRLDEPTSMHWHGFLQRGTRESDGVPCVTQTPIAAGTTMKYRFQADVPGTYWYHSHYGMQYVDGQRGTFVVKDPRDEGRYADTVLQITDWYLNNTNTDMETEFLVTDNDGAEPVPDSVLVGGAGQAYCTSGPCRYASYPARVGTCARPATKLRLVNTGGFAPFWVNIHNHLMIVTGIDTTPTMRAEPATHIFINIGERYDVFVCPDTVTLSSAQAKALAGTKHLINITLDQYSMPTEAGSPNPTTLAILDYTQSVQIATPFDPIVKLIPPANLPNTTGPAVPGVVIGKARPGAASVRDPYTIPPLAKLPPPPAPSSESVLYLEMATGTDAPYTRSYDTSVTGQAHVANNIQRAHWNGVSANLEEYCGGQCSGQNGLSGVLNALSPQSVIDASGYDPTFEPNVGPYREGMLVIKVQQGTVHRVVINNNDDAEHPIHLHGHTFWVLSRGEEGAGFYNASTAKFFNPPPMRDTVTIRGGSYLVLEFVADNPGVWVMHCHIEWHMMTGLLMTFVVGDFPAPGRHLAEQAAASVDTPAVAPQTTPTTATSVDTPVATVAIATPSTGFVAAGAAVPMIAAAVVAVALLAGVVVGAAVLLSKRRAAAASALSQKLLVPASAGDAEEGLATPVASS